MSSTDETRERDQPRARNEARPNTVAGPSTNGSRVPPPQATRPRRVPAAREETLELSTLPAAPPRERRPSAPQVPVQPPAHPAPTPALTPTSAPAPGRNASPVGTTPVDAPPTRPAPDDAAAEVWALVERAQAGDGQAFGAIYERYFDTVFRFIYYRVGSRPLAEDLTSDTFLRALKRIGTITWQGRDLGAWLITIARHLVVDHFKSGKTRLETPTGDQIEPDRPDLLPEPSPEEAVVDYITNKTLLAAVRQLNPEQQECIVLRFLMGFSVAETAGAMGKNEGAIKALQYRATHSLKRLLPEGFLP